MSRTPGGALALVACSWLAACLGPPGAIPGHTAVSASSTMKQPDSCPLTIAGVRADIASTADGVAITLDAPPDQLMLLRARAHALPGTAGGVLAACPCGPPSAPPAGTQVTVDDTEGGAVVGVTSRDPDDAPALQAAVRSQLGRVHAGDCVYP